jgi:hypothetical protein
LSIDISPEQLEAAIARIEQEKERRIAERVEAGELVTVPLSVTVGTAAEIPAAVEQAEANKLAELRSAGETREVVFGGTICVTGVCRLAGGEEWKPAPGHPCRTWRRTKIRKKFGRNHGPRSWKATCGFKRDRAATMATTPVRYWRGGFRSTTGL